MGHNTLVREMSSPGPKQALIPRERVPQAVEALQPLTGTQMTEVIIARLQRDPNRGRFLQAPGKDEEPTTLFVDVVKYGNDPELAEKLRFACVQAIRKVGLEPAPAAELLGDLCYLAVALGATEAIDLLISIISREDALRLLIGNGEDICLRALRALVGLVAQTRERSQRLREVFERLLPESRYRLLALTGLVGLWPEKRSEYMGKFPEIDGQRLNLNLEFVGFNSATSAVAHL